MTVLITGGAGFIGSNFVLDWLAASDEPIVNLEKLTYDGNPDNFSSLRGNDQNMFTRGDIYHDALASSLLDTYNPRAIVHFAAETHVDRSIHGPVDFIRTNVDRHYLRRWWYAIVSGNDGSFESAAPGY